MKHNFFTSESVTEGHPDKIADRISDAILDECLKTDPNSRVAIETMVKCKLVILAGEITTRAIVDYEKIVRDTVDEIGDPEFNGKNITVIMNITSQSGDIALGVDDNEFKELGAGDQGFMIGMATNETESFMPMTIYLANKLAYQLALVRKKGVLPYLLPDGKTQVSLEYDNGQIKRLEAVVISSQHKENVSLDKLRADIKKEVILSIIPSNLIDANTKIFINPTGRFLAGGPSADCGLTGRKIIIDTYGGHIGHGGGAFSGKDPTKVDRSANYYCRYVAKHLVAAGLASYAVVQVAYAIGIPHPLALSVDAVSDFTNNELLEIIKKHFDFRPEYIIAELNLARPLYKGTSSYGHFGRSAYPWEDLKKIDEIKKYKR